MFVDTFSVDDMLTISFGIKTETIIVGATNSLHRLCITYICSC